MCAPVGTLYTIPGARVPKHLTPQITGGGCMCNHQARNWAAWMDNVCPAHTSVIVQDVISSASMQRHHSFLHLNPSRPVEPAQPAAFDSARCASGRRHWRRRWLCDKRRFLRHCCSSSSSNLASASPSLAQPLPPSLSQPRSATPFPILIMPPGAMLSGRLVFAVHTAVSTPAPQSLADACVVALVQFASQGGRRGLHALLRIGRACAPPASVACLGGGMRGREDAMSGGGGTAGWYPVGTTRRAFGRTRVHAGAINRSSCA